MKKFLSSAIVLLILCIISTQISGFETDNKFTIIFSDDPPTFYEASGRWYVKPNNYSELISWYQHLEENFSNYLYVWKANEMYGLGKIPDEGYDLYMVRITNESFGLHKPEVLFTLTIHGNERVGTNGGYWVVDWLMRHAYHPDYDCPEREWLQWLIDNREIYFVPCLNPDGYDENHRGDDSGRDLNRDFGHSRINAWQSINTKTVRRFVNNHTIRTTIDMHTGTRGIPYPWSNKDVRLDLWGVSPISGYNYSSHCPPDFYYFDACYLRMGDYIGNYGGDFNENNINPWANGPCLGYDADGTSCDWMYGADVIRHPAEDPYVEDEIFGPDPGSSVMSTLVEFGPSDPDLGNDTNNRYGAEVRRCMLHQIDFAQPYIRWQQGTPENNSLLNISEYMIFKWQVNGSLVVDSTLIQWSTDPDPINNPEYNTTANTTHAGDWYGGTGWDNAEDGETDSITYKENISLDAPGEYYFVAKAKVDQIYKNVIHTDEYGDESYLRIIHERTNESYYEEINGTDGLEVVKGQLWWYSPIIHVTIIPETGSPDKTIIDGPSFGKPEKEYTFSFVSSDPENEDVYYYIDWDDGAVEEWIGPYKSGEIINVSHSWTDLGDYKIRARAKDTNGARGIWSDSFNMHIGLPALDIGSLKGGLFKVKSIIKNKGEAEATDIQWTITLDGGLILLGKESSGEIGYLDPGEEAEINSKIIFGLGKTVVRATADIPEHTDTRDQRATVVLFFINVNPGG